MAPIADTLEMCWCNENDTLDTRSGGGLEIQGKGGREEERKRKGEREREREVGSRR